MVALGLVFVMAETNGRQVRLPSSLNQVLPRALGSGRPPSLPGAGATVGLTLALILLHFHW